jgi:hypothetical protein
MMEDMMAGQPQDMIESDKGEDVADEEQKLLDDMDSDIDLNADTAAL